MSDKPYVTARRAAELIGCSETAVIYDVQEGMDGKIGTLTGGREGGFWLVHSSDLEGAELDKHRARLADRESV